MPDKSDSSLLVTGTNGHLGREVVELLLDAGATNVVAASRTPEKLADLAARGAEVRKADFDDPVSLEQAFAGTDRLLIISVPDTPHDPPLRLRQHLAAVEAAAKAGVKHIVYTSMQKPEPGSPIPFAPDHFGTEQAIEKTDIPFTILRPNWYTDSIVMWLPQVLASGQWITSTGDGKVAYLWRDDLARTAVAALLEDTSESRRLDVSGPEALTADDIVATVNDVFGASVEIEPVTDKKLRDRLTVAGLPATLVDLLVAIDANTRQGGVETVSDAVEQLTGRKPRSLRTFLIENRDVLLAAASAVSR